MEDPSVTTWRIALAPRPRYRVGRHWWRELVVSHWRAAYDQWQLDAEAASNGWTTERREFAAEHPPPRLSVFMAGLSQGAIAP